jgi:hypothetical protein
VNQVDLKQEFKGLCQQISSHELRQNPELDDATRAMKLALYRLKQQQYREESDVDSSNEKAIGVYEN